MLYDDEQKSKREFRVFQEFTERSGLAIDPDSIEKRNPPEPDMLCRVSGEGYVAFELKELCDEEIAKTISDLIKTKNEEPVYLRTGTPRHNFMRRTRKKKYECNHPIELLFYTADRFILPPDVIIPEIQFYFDNNRHTFRRVWFMGFPEEICKCVVVAA